MKRMGLVLVVALAALVAAPAAMAAETFTLFGDAQIISPGNASPNAVQVRSNTATSPGYGGIDFQIPPGTTFANFTTLSTDYMFESDDSCGGGSPRFQINLDSGSGDTGNIFVYIGSPPSWTGCPADVWQNTGDLLEGANQVDTTQLDGGAYADTYDAAAARYANYTVTGVQLVVDAGWFFADGEQTVFFDTTNVNGTIYPYETTSDLLSQLRSDTVNLVDHAKSERTLLASLARAERFLNDADPNNDRLALLGITSYILQLQVFEVVGVVPSDVADQLLAQAYQIAESLNP